MSNYYCYTCRFIMARDPYAVDFVFLHVSVLYGPRSHTTLSCCFQFLSANMKNNKSISTVGKPKPVSDLPEDPIEDGSSSDTMIVPDTPPTDHQCLTQSSDVKECDKETVLITDIQDSPDIECLEEEGIVVRADLGGPAIPVPLEVAYEVGINPHPAPPQSPPGVSAPISNFRFQRKYAMFTYKSHIPKDAYKLWLENRTHRVCDFIRLAHETADANHPYIHTHALVDFGKAFSTRNCHFFCWPTEDKELQDSCGGIHCNIRFYNLKSVFESVKNYIAKEDPDNADLKVDNTFLVDRVHAAPSAIQALRDHVTRPGDVSGILQLYNMRPEPELTVCDRPNFPWHRDLLQELESSTRGPLRLIRWYYDPVGGTGKSWLIKYLEDNYRDPILWTALSGLENARETANLLVNARSQGWTGFGVLIDLSRAFEFGKVLYSILESLKNGRLSSTKYQGARLRLDGEPWLIVMSNFWPQVGNMSMDRWDIREILPDRTAVPRHPHYREPRDRTHGVHTGCQTCSCNRIFTAN